MKHKKGSPLIFLGLLLVAAALLLTGYNLYDGQRAAKSVEGVLGQLEEFCPALAQPKELAHQPKEPAQPMLAEEPDEVEIPDYLLDPSMNMPVWNVDGQDYIGILRIPSLGLELPVLSSWSYPRLKIAPCRYAGSAYQGNFIIAAHNYVSHFGPLKYLEVGDRITFTDMDGNVFHYEVALMETLAPTAVVKASDGWDLSLFTCTISGADRVTVHCERVD